MINKIVKRGQYKGFNYMVKHLDLTDNTRKGNIDYSIPLSHTRTTDWYCGYVEIPKGHELYGKDEMEIYHNEDLSVHGGLTFGGRFEEDGEYYIGFDCHHAWDNSIEQNADYVEEQCKYLIDQLKELEMTRHVLITARVGHDKLVEPVIVTLPLEKGHLETLKRIGKLENHIINEAANYIKKELEIINITERESDRFDEFLESMREDNKGNKNE